MSIKLMSHIWEHATVGGSDLLVLLALADYANDDGESIYPSMQSLAKKARLSVDQTRRVIHKLIGDGVIELVQAGGWDGNRNRSNEYRILPDGTSKMQAPRKMKAPGTRARGGTGVDARTVLAPVQEDPLLEPSLEPSIPEDDDDNAREAHGAVFTAWSENIPGTMTPILGDKLHDLIDECGPVAVVHGIVTSVEAGARNFKYIAAVARNHAAGKEPPARASPGYRRHGKTERETERKNYRPEEYSDIILG